MAKRRKSKSKSIGTAAALAGFSALQAGPEVRLNAGFSLVLDAAPNGVVPLRIGKLTFPLSREDAISMLFGDEPDVPVSASLLKPARATGRKAPKRKVKRPRLKRKSTGKVKAAASGTTSVGYAESRKRYREFAAAYRAGESATSIAKRYGVAMQTVYYGLSYLKVPKRRKAPKPAASKAVAAS